MDAKSFLYVYDRVPRSFRVRTGWKADPKTPPTSARRSASTLRVTVKNK